MRQRLIDGSRQPGRYFLRQRPGLACQYPHFDPASFLQFTQKIGGRYLVHGKVVQLDRGNAGRIDFEQLSLRASRIQGVHDEQAPGTRWTEAKREEEIAHTGAGVQHTDVVGHAMVGFHVLHQRAPETVISEQKIATTQDQCGLSAILG
jgi:hypothetical protein